jgi:cell division protein FtsB
MNTDDKELQKLRTQISQLEQKIGQIEKDNRILNLHIKRLPEATLKIFKDQWGV